MTPENFCYWLQGFFELGGARGRELSPEWIEEVRKHLDLVFKHVSLMKNPPIFAPPDDPKGKTWMEKLGSYEPPKYC